MKTILKIRRFWRGIYEVTWKDRLNGRRQYATLFHLRGKVWFSGEEHPQGCYSSLLREAEPEIASALSNFHAKSLLQDADSLLAKGERLDCHLEEVSAIRDEIGVFVRE